MLGMIFIGHHVCAVQVGKEHEFAMLAKKIKL
jgi:hypothetical protein